MASLASHFPFLVGCTIDGDPAKNYSDAERKLTVDQFNCFTVENSLKSQSLQPIEGQFDFARPDKLLAFAEEHKLKMIGHCLVWHHQCPDWLFHRGGELADCETVLARLNTHISTVMKRYKGKIIGWDVVNEAISDGGDQQLRRSKFTETVGENFVVEAFKLAHAADPDMPLYYNDYSIEQPGKRKKTIELLKQIQKDAPRIDAVGIQGHWMLGGVPLAAIEAAILEYAKLGLKVMITELDIDVLRRDKEGADVSATQNATTREAANQLVCPPEILKRQADDYAALFRLFRKHQDKISRVTFWGLHDGRSWLNNWPIKGRINHALLFDRNCQPKPAYDAVMGV